MSIVDLSLKNESIKDYFLGSDFYVPVSELIYVHEHPMIRPNFLADLEVIILRTSKLMEDKNIKGKVVDKFLNLTIKLGQELPVISKENAPRILSTLRAVYMLCTKLLERHNVVY